MPPTPMPNGVVFTPIPILATSGCKAQRPLNLPLALAQMVAKKATGQLGDKTRNNGNQKHDCNLHGQAVKFVFHCGVLCGWRSGL